EPEGRMFESCRAHHTSFFALWISPRRFRYNPGMRNACLLATIATMAIAAMAQDPDRFYSVIRENNLTQLKVLLGQTSKAAVADSRGITPLMYAAEIGSLEAMRLLIDGGADVNAQNAF